MTHMICRFVIVFNFREEETKLWWGLVPKAGSLLDLVPGGLNIHILCTPRIINLTDLFI